MSNGTGGTIVLRPHGGTAITLNMSRTDPVSPETYALFVNLGELRLNEAARIQWNYDESIQGGLAVNLAGGIVPIVIPIRITATTSPARVTAYNAVLLAVANLRGGTLEYKPEGHTSSTFYHYQPSAGPSLLQTPSNRWDRAAESDGYYVLDIEVELSTQPYATSDPDVAINMIAAGQADQTVYPGEGTYADIGLEDKLDIDNLGGVAGMLTRVLAFGADGQDVGRVISFIKSGDGKDADHIIESSNATIVGDSTYWSTVTDATRYGGDYLHLAPVDGLYDVDYVHRYTLPNPEYWEGRVAVFALGNDRSGVSGAWTHKAVLRFGEKVVQTSDANYARLYGNWQLIYIGELQLPPTALSLDEKDAGYGTACYIEIVSSRTSGKSAVDFEALCIAQVSDAEGTGAVLDVVCDQDDAIVAATSRLVMENRVGQNGQPMEVAHALTSGDLAFDRTLSVAPRGRFLTLDPSKESTVRFVHEQALDEPYVENASAYNGIYNYTLGNFGSDVDGVVADEGWALTSASTYAEFDLYAVYYLEGTYTGRIKATTDEGYTGYGRIERNISLDLSDPSGIFTENDMFCFSRWWNHVHSAVNYARVGFIDSGELMAYTTIQTLTTGYVNRATRRSDLTIADGFDWSGVTKVFIDYGVDGGAANVDSVLLIDNIRIEKRNPSRMSEPNATGGQWEFDNGKNWGVTTDMMRYFYTYWPAVGFGTKPGGIRRDLDYTIACLGLVSSEHYFAVLQEDAPEYFQLSARLTDQSLNMGACALTWCVDDDLLDGVENYYSVRFRTEVTNTNWVYLNKVTGGVDGYPGSLSSGDSTVEDVYGLTWREGMLIGVRVNRASGETKVYWIGEGKTDADTDLWDDDNLRWEYTDTDFMTNTKVGLMSTLTGRVRADKFILSDMNNRMNPTDDLRVAVQGQYRTTIPLE